MSVVAQSVGVNVAAQVARELYPGSTVVAIERAGAGEVRAGELVPLGEPLLVRLEMLDGQIADLLFQTRDGRSPALRLRSDRAAALLGAFEAFKRVPRHARALDVGALGPDGAPLSLRDSGEFYLVTEVVLGFAYAEQLRTIAERGELQQADLDHTNELALCLAELHARVTDAPAYRQSVRELVGGDTGVLALVDGYPNETPGVPRELLERLERLVLPWRWKLRECEHRATRIHGDLNPSNVVWTENGPRLLEASKRGVGDPADDVVGVCFDFVMFGLLWPGTWKPCFRRLWNAYWNAYLGETADAALLQIAAPFIARRALCLCSPVLHPGTPALVRERLLGLVEQVLGEPSFDPAVVESLFRDEEPRSLR
jgi:hypothetical protein